VSERKTVWYIGIIENNIAKPIPEKEAEKICDLLNMVMKIPEENLEKLLVSLKSINEQCDKDKRAKEYAEWKKYYSM
jgi:hypothetical protein